MLNIPGAYQETPLEQVLQLSLLLGAWPETQGFRAKEALGFRFRVFRA